MRRLKTSVAAACLLLAACSVLNAPETLRPADGDGSGGTNAMPGAGTAGSTQNQGGKAIGMGGGAAGDCGVDCPPEGGAPPIGRECDDSAADCGSTAPICGPADGKCRACGTDAECKTSTGRDYCAKSGRCAECRTDTDCGGAKPVCGNVGDCRGCAAHDECASGVCESETGSCAAPSTAVYVLAETGVGDATCGSIETPCLSLTEAAKKLTAARPNLVLLATTQELKYGGATLPPITGLRVIGNGVVIAPYDSAFRVPAGASVVFDEVVIQDVALEKPDMTIAAGIECTNASIVVKNSTFLNNRRGLAALDCNVVVSTSLLKGNANPLEYSDAALNVSCTLDTCMNTLTVERSRFEDNGVALTVSGINTAKIENNLFLRNGSNNYTRVIQLGAQTTKFAYNTLVENFNNCIFIGVVVCNGTVASIGNLAFNNFPGQEAMCPSQLFYGCSSGMNTMTYNLTEVPYPGVGNKSGNPLFVDAINGNYTPGPGSPAIDKGSPDNAPTDDLNGAPRPVGAGPDIGAIEVQ